jgi:HK97 family phage prohead protease
MQLEKRFFPFEVRVIEGDTPKIEGTGVVYNQLSVVMYGMFREQIKPGAFSESIAKRDVRTLWNHNTDFPLGRTGNGTVRITEGEDGISFENDPPQTSWGQDAVASIRRRDVNQMSFGFMTTEDSWGYDSENQLIRTIVKGELWELSPVTFAAYPQTEVSIRSIEARKGVLAAVYEANPTIPDWVRAHLERNETAEAAQVRWVQRNRALMLME